MVSDDADPLAPPPQPTPAQLNMTELQDEVGRLMVALKLIQDRSVDPWAAHFAHITLQGTSHG